MTIEANVWVRFRMADAEGRKFFPKMLTLTYSKPADRRRKVKELMRAWAAMTWPGQNPVVEISLLDTEGGAQIMINGQSEPCARFGLAPKGDYSRPAPTLFDAGGRA